MPSRLREGTSCFSRFISATFSRRARGSPRNLCIETSPVATLASHRSRPRSRPSAFPRTRGKTTLIMIIKFHGDESRFQRAPRIAKVCGAFRDSN